MSGHTFEWVMSHICLSHVIHTNKSRLSFVFSHTHSTDLTAALENKNFPKKKRFKT